VVVVLHVLLTRWCWCWVLRVLRQVRPGIAAEAPCPLTSAPSCSTSGGTRAGAAPLRARLVHVELRGPARTCSCATTGRVNETGVVVETMEKGPWDYWHLRQMLRSVFCLGPAVCGWGMQRAAGRLMGCIPVVIQVHPCSLSPLLLVPPSLSPWPSSVSWPPHIIARISSSLAARMQ